MAEAMTMPILRKEGGNPEAARDSFTPAFRERNIPRPATSWDSLEGSDFMRCRRMRCVLRKSVCIRRQEIKDWDGTPGYLECHGCRDGLRIRAEFLRNRERPSFRRKRSRWQTNPA